MWVACLDEFGEAGVSGRGANREIGGPGERQARVRKQRRAAGCLLRVIFIQFILL